MDISQQIIQDEYNRQRLLPVQGDPLYLILSDLRLALEQVKTDAKIKILDFGCGGSPYKALFPNAIYKRADYLKTTNLDYIISENSRIEEQDDFFDMVLSTQVLEHVQEPDTYIQESFRILKPGGLFICSTHGTYEEHGCPYDYYRWTSDGLCNLLKKHNFNIWNIFKLTTGMRAALFLFQHNINKNNIKGEDLFSKSVNSLANLLKINSKNYHKWCDKIFSENRITEEKDALNALYIGLFSVSQK